MELQLPSGGAGQSHAARGTGATGQGWCLPRGTAVCCAKAAAFRTASACRLQRGGLSCVPRVVGLEASAAGSLLGWSHPVVHRTRAGHRGAPSMPGGKGSPRGRQPGRTRPRHAALSCTDCTSAGRAAQRVAGLTGLARFLCSQLGTAYVSATTGAVVTALGLKSLTKVGGPAPLRVGARLARGPGRGTAWALHRGTRVLAGSRDKTIAPSCSGSTPVPPGAT